MIDNWQQKKWRASIALIQSIEIRNDTLRGTLRAEALQSS